MTEISKQALDLEYQYWQNKIDNLEKENKTLQQQLQEQKDYIKACADMIGGEGLLAVRIDALKEKLDNACAIANYRLKYLNILFDAVGVSQAIRDEAEKTSDAATEIKAMRNSIQHIQNWIHNEQNEKDITLQASQSGRNVCEWIIEYVEELRQEKQNEIPRTT